MTAMFDAGDFAGWTPIRVYRDGEGSWVDWCETGSTRFVAPFFRETIGEVMARPAAALLRRQTPLAMLGEVAAADPGLAPAGLIFHASRCGSTLLARMLAASGANRVLSEPEPVESVLRFGARAPVVAEDEMVESLRALVSVLGRSQEEERRLFVKLHVSNILAFPVIRRAFPEVPWVFCFRDPVEIMVSLAAVAGSDFVVGPVPPELYGLDLATAASLPPNVYAAQVLHTVFGAAARFVGDGGLLVDYARLPGAFDEVLTHLGVDPDDGERAAMVAVAAFDAKAPGKRFVADSAARQAAADDAVRQAAALVGPAFGRLLELEREHRPVPVR